MPHIKFMRADDLDVSKSDVAARLYQFLNQLRAGKRANAEGTTGSEQPKNARQFGYDYDHLSITDVRRINARVNRYVKEKQAKGQFSHLNQTDKNRLDVFRKEMKLITIENEHKADEIASAIHADAPWMSEATSLIWYAMRRSVREGWPGLRLPPLLVDGPPGTGKSHWGRLVGKALGTPIEIADATVENAGFAIAGSQRGWGSAHPGRVVETVARTRVANPLFIIDEVEKAGDVTSNAGGNFSLAHALLPMLEPLSAANWSCPYYQVKFDVSWIMWIMTTNDSRLLPAPLLSRCPPIMVRDLTSEELTRFLQRQAAHMALDEAATNAVLDILAFALGKGIRVDLRSATRMLDLALDLQSRPRLQ